jgi:hypothetical protein
MMNCFMIENYSIELFPDPDKYPYLHSITIPYISNWKIKNEDVLVHSKSVHKPSYEEWKEILNLELQADKEPNQVKIEKFFKLDNIQKRVLNTLENHVIDIKYNLISKSHTSEKFLYLYDEYKYNINGQILIGKCRRMSGGFFLRKIESDEFLIYKKEDFYD